jgi:hypothetical protein
MSRSGVFRSRTIPRILGIALVLAALLGLSGCWVSSINPLYDEGTVDHPHNDSDVVLTRA